MDFLSALVPGLVALVLPAASHALGADAPLDAKHAWVKDAVKAILDGMILNHVKVPNWAVSLEQPIEDIIDAELEKVLAKAGA